MPNFIIDIVRVLRAVKFFLLKKSVLVKNSSYKDKFRGEDVFILANGPSLVIEQLEKIKGKNVITMNDFHRAKGEFDLKIVAHCSGEPHTSTAWTDPSEMIRLIDSQSFWFNIYDHDVMGKISDINKEINYVNPGFGHNSFFNEINLSKICFNYQTSAQFAIQVAIYMGFKNIYLLGFDHDWLASPKFSKHFFSDKKQANDMIHEKSYLELIKMCKEIWEMYYKLRKISKTKGVSILNLSKDSYLDIFLNKDISEVI